MNDTPEVPKVSDGTDKLLEVLDEAIGRIHDDSKRHKNNFRKVQTAIIILTATTTAVAGAGLVLPDSRNVVQFVVLVLAATTTAVTSWGEMMRSRELWRHERQLYWSLSDIRREVDFLRHMKELTEDEVKKYFGQATSILGSSVEGWSGIAGQQK